MSDGLIVVVGGMGVSVAQADRRQTLTNNMMMLSQMGLRVCIVQFLLLLSVLGYAFLDKTGIVGYFSTFTYGAGWQSAKMADVIITKIPKR